MKIRFATLDDIPASLEAGREFHALTRFAGYDYNVERLSENLRAVIAAGQNAKGTHCFFVAEDDHAKFCGVLIGCVERHFFSDHLVASVIHYDVLPDKRMSGAGLKLLTAFRKWADNRGVFELSVGVNSGVGIEKTDRFLKRLGFAQTGGNYSLTIGHANRAKQTNAVPAEHIQ
jgi:N-acetylglutamate synthase-like GNAT family acetyltransferase